MKENTIIYCETIFLLDSLLIAYLMSRRRNRNMSHILRSSNDPDYFLITITNYPALLRETQELQHLPTQVRFVVIYKLVFQLFFDRIVRINAMSLCSYQMYQPILMF